MHTTDLSAWTHDHVFDRGNTAGERGTRAVVVITATMMLAEVVAGMWFNSMALLADGLHMASHALAIGLSAIAYVAARRYAADARFAFGTWKIEVLSGFASAVILMMIAGLMIVGAVERMLAPKHIHYQQALVVAAIGLVCTSSPTPRRRCSPSSRSPEAGRTAGPGSIRRWQSPAPCWWPRGQRTC